jgi:radical SAM superfamily enzyme YgiQ (UPF0313 family)
MRICLANAPTAAEFADSTELRIEAIRKETCEPQLGILSLAAVLERDGCAPRIVDLNRHYYRHVDAAGCSGIDDFARVAATEMTASGAQVYAFGSICSGYPLTVRIAREIKALAPESVVLIGGPQASVVSTQTLEAFPFVDFILRGEAEHSLPILLEEIGGRAGFDRVPGLTHRTPFGVQRNPDSPLVADLDELPSPAYHLTGELRGLHRASLELGRGCPFACTFCSTNDFFRRKFRLRSPARVLRDMRALEAEYGIRDFDLVHDMFTVDAKRVQAFCHALMDSGEGYTWSCSARTDCVDEELIELMAAAGCKGMFFGVETGSARMQKIIDKHLDTHRAHEIIDIAERAGVRTTVSLITGFPQENRDDLRDTVRMFMHSARVPGSGPQLNLLAPLANTPLHLEFKDEMTLDLLCSDMSHQGRHQHAEDMELIRQYPSIFPNFYLLPTPHLDRGMLLELREFTLMATTRFRWLISAADQARGAANEGILDIFVDWLAWRDARYPALAGSEMRHYYRTPQFRLDFTVFLGEHPVGRDPAVALLLNYEDAVIQGAAPDTSRLRGASRLEVGEPLDWADIPVRDGQCRIIELSSDLQKVIDGVKHHRQPEWTRGPHFYVVAQAEATLNSVYHVSRRIAKALKACDGRRTMKQVVRRLAAELPEIPAPLRDYAFIALLEKAHAEGLLAIYRAASEAADNQNGGLSMPEYSETSAATSAQNVSSAQAQ